MAKKLTPEEEQAIRDKHTQPRWAEPYDFTIVQPDSPVAEAGKKRFEDLIDDETTAQDVD